MHALDNGVVFFSQLSDEEETEDPFVDIHSDYEPPRSCLILLSIYLSVQPPITCIL